jgi:hypothetical protein
MLPDVLFKTGEAHLLHGKAEHFALGPPAHKSTVHRLYRKLHKAGIRAEPCVVVGEVVGVVPIARTLEKRPQSSLEIDGFENWCADCSGVFRSLVKRHGIQSWRL